MHLEELRGFLLSERDSGTLIQIPADLYQTTAALIRTLQQEVLIMDDPFSDEARLLIEKVASIRTTAEELFHLRSEKIVDLAGSQADGSYIEREELRTLIPAELEMFNRIVDAIRFCRGSLIEWRPPATRVPVRVEIPARMAEPGAEPAEPGAGDQPENDSLYDEEDDSGVVQTEPGISPERAYFRAEEQGRRAPPDEEPFSYTLVRVLANMEAFMGVDGRTYELADGDIITLPQRNAEVLAERDIVLNINPG